MPWTASGGNEYKLCLLDTNIISEIIKNKTGEGKGFFEKYPPSTYVACITVYSLIELRRNASVYEKFLDTFSKIPFFILKPLDQLFSDECVCYDNGSSLQPILAAISPLNENPKLYARNLLDALFVTKEVIEVEKAWRKDETKVLNNWLSRKTNFKTTLDVANSADAERYLEEAGLQSILGFGLEWARPKIEAQEIIDIAKFPSVVLMLYSQYYRLYDPHWKPRPQEVTDIQIISPAPYVDVVITEKFQAEILKKVRKKVRGMGDLEIATLRDIRS